MAARVGVHQLLLQGLQGAVVDVDGAPGPGSGVAGALLGALPAEGDVEVTPLRLGKLNAISLLCGSQTCRHSHTDTNTNTTEHI